MRLAVLFLSIVLLNSPVYSMDDYTKFIRSLSQKQVTGQMAFLPYKKALQQIVGDIQYYYKFAEEPVISVSCVTLFRGDCVSRSGMFRTGVLRLEILSKKTITEKFGIGIANDIFKNDEELKQILLPLSELKKDRELSSIYASFLSNEQLASADQN